jgi:hypothetical protein
MDDWESVRLAISVSIALAPQRFRSLQLREAASSDLFILVFGVQMLSSGLTGRKYLG